MTDRSPPRVTVITIFLDPGAHLLEAIDSVARQTVPGVEHLLVDDGSTDGSTEVARAAATADPDRVRYLDHEGHANLGMSRSRNAGLARARGELVAFLDADDVWFDDAVEQQLAQLDAHPTAQMAIGATEYWRSAAGGDPEDDHVQPQRPLGLVEPPLLARERLYQRLPPPSINALLIRREALQAVGGFEAAFVSMFEDQAMLFKFLLRHPVVVHGGVIDRYRQHPGSASARAMAEGAYDPVVPGPAMRAFRSFARSYVRTTPWRGSIVDREARWYARFDRWGPTRRLVHRLRPGRITRYLTNRRRSRA